jgi:hypothetical protein
MILYIVCNIYLPFSLVKDKIKDDELRRACSRHGEKGNTYRILVGKPEGNRPLGRKM